MPRAHQYIISAMLLGLAFWASGLSGGQQQSSLAHNPATGSIPEGLSGDDWADISNRIVESKYLASEHGEGGFIASNPAHGWDIQYSQDGTTSLRPAGSDDNAYFVHMKLSRLGYGTDNIMDQPQSLSANEFSVNYQWSDSMREWWVNSSSGLEQWFELLERPAGTQTHQLLTLNLTLDTSLAVTQHGNVLSLIDPSGASISYSKLKAWDSRGQEMPSQMKLLAGEVQLIIDDRDAIYPLIIDPTFQQQAYLKASNTEGGDGFGSSVAISGGTVVVGAPREDSNAVGVNGDQSNNSSGGSGAAYVFVRDGSSWTQQAYLKASNTNTNDDFGEAVAISGDTIVVGAKREDSSAAGVNGDHSNNSLPSAGAVYVFVRDGSSWTQQAYLKASNPGGADNFGIALAVSVDTVVVGANEDSNATGVDGDQTNNSLINSGAAYIFVRSENVWTQQAYLKASNTAGGDEFGLSVAISGDTVVVGARGEDGGATGVGGNQSSNSSGNSGAAYVFTRSGATWSQQAYVKASNTDVGDGFGRSVAIYGDTLVAGAAGEDSNATGVDGDQGDNSATGSGAAYVFTLSGGIWGQQAYLKASNAETSDGFALQVAIFGNAIVVSAAVEDSNATGIGGSQSDNSASASGAAYIFVRSGDVWDQQAYVKASNSEGSDYFGGSVSISGGKLVIGARSERSNATGVNGDESDNSAFSSGAAYIINSNLIRRVITVSG